MNTLQNIFLNFIVYATDTLGVSSSFKPILSGLIALSSAAAALSTAICIIRYMVADDPQSMSYAKRDLITVWIAYICLNSIGLIVSFVLSLVESSNF